MRRCEVRWRDKKMEMRQCTSGLVPEEEKQSSCVNLEGKSLFYVLKGQEQHHIIKLDLSRDFFTPPSSPRYIGRSKATRPQPPLPLRNRRYSLHRFSRFLHTVSMKRWKRSDLGQFVPTLPQPYLKVDLPEEVAMVALGSKIYFIGGELEDEDADGEPILPREVYAVDTAREPPEMVKFPCLLNHGKEIPITWTVGGKIYAMPSSFTPYDWPGHAPGKLLECFDPETMTWTVLPDPPLGDSVTCPAGFEILSAHGGHEVPLMMDPQGVESHALLGSTLLISMEGGGVYAFDTVRTSWRRIFIQLSPRLLLDFLPFDSMLDVSMVDDLVLCPPQYNDSGDFLSKLLERQLNIKWSDSYICRFTNTNESQILNVSIQPLDWDRETTRWFKFVRSFPNCKVTGEATGIGDRVFIFARNGHDYKFGVDNGDKGHHYFSLNLFRVSKESHNYETSEVASALFRSPSFRHPHLCFVMEKGVFIK